MTMLEADALSLDADGEGDAPRLLPVRHRAGEANLPLLPEDRQRSFSLDQFHRWPTARAVYSLPGGVYVVLSPPPVQRMGTTSVIWFGVHIILLRQLGQRLLTLDRSQRHLGFEGRGVGPSCPFCRACS
jgi:hypothetical protein